MYIRQARDIEKAKSHESAVYRTEVCFSIPNRAKKSNIYLQYRIISIIKTKELWQTDLYFLHAE